MAVVIEFFVLKVLISGLQAFQPDVAICAVDREMVGNEELQPATDMATEPMLGIGEVTGAIDCGEIPTPAAENERRQTGCAKRIDEQRSLYGIGVRLRSAVEFFSTIVG